MKKLTYAAGVAALGLALQAHAELMLDQTVVASFLPGDGGIKPGNDLPNAPPAVRMGQLLATETGTVQFYFTGSEAAYTNTMRIDGNTFAAPPDFMAPDTPLAPLAITAGTYVDFGFCTSGGASVGVFGMCASNNNAASLTAQYNYKESPTDNPGYRSISFRALNSYDPIAGLSNAAVSTYSPVTVTNSALWAIFWDDSGARNDDDFDDYVAVIRFLPNTRVPEPLTLTLLGSSLLGVGLMRRRGERRSC